MALGQPVEAGEKFVEQRDEIVRVGLVGQRGEVHDIGKQHGHFGEALGDVALAALQPFGDGLRQDVEQESLGFFLLDFKELFLLLELDHAQPLQIPQALALQRGGHAGAQDRGVHWLGQEVLRPHLDASRDGIELVHSRGDDDRQMVQEGIILHRLEQGEPIHRGHLHVGDEQVELSVPQCGQSFLAIARLGEVLVTERPQHQQQHVAHGVLIIHYEDGRLLAGPVRLGPLELLCLLRGEATLHRAAQQMERAALILRQGRVAGIHGGRERF